MTPKQLEKCGVEIYGEQWQSKLARALAINPRTMRRFLAGDAHIPLTIALAVLFLLVEHRGIFFGRSGCC